MKKNLFHALQFVSLFLFVVLFTGVYGVFKKIVNSQEGLAFNLGYGLAGVLILCLLFWLNIKLFRYASRNTSKK